MPETLGLTPLQRALLALRELKARVEAAEGTRSAPIAIVGLGCRFPGGATDPESYWRLLREGREGIREVPPDRWDLEAYYDPDPDAPGKMYTRRGGFLGRVDLFDPHFFGIAPREAGGMDPQQRLLLEVAWEALENAGLAPATLAGTRTGVFVGISGSEYSAARLKDADARSIDAYSGAGSSPSIASGRLSYLLGLQGPSLSVDTACSSSLVAVHLALRSLRGGECSLALAGGVNVLLLPEAMVTLCRARMLSADGRCKTFDASANGYVRGEGCGVVVLKRLADAVADEDEVLAVIRGSALNQDGRSGGLTAPNGLAQEAVIREAVLEAGVEALDIQYVEAHGTGTPLGDPIEMRALGAALGGGRNRERPLYVGSMKTNVGHLEAAAGMAGLIKVVLSLRHGEIPPHLHFEDPNPHIPWAELPVEVATRLIPWRGEAGAPRRAGVSSFGFSGTNAHVVLEEAPRREERKPGLERPLHVLALSAKGERALRELAGHYERELEERPALSLADACYTAGAGRSHFSNRLALVVGSVEEARTTLRTCLAGGVAPGLLSGAARSGDGVRLAFLFTGQGSQYAGMGRELYETQPVFREALEHCGEILRPLLGKPLLEVLYPKAGDEGLIDETGYTQPGLFALEWSLSELWRSWGVEPSVVLGHSVGEYVAACVAGVYSVEDGLRLISERGRLMQGLAPGGAMAAVFCGEERVVEALKGYAGRVSLAAVNGIEDVVISGHQDALEEVLGALGRAGVKGRRLTVSHAFHSALMEPMLKEFERVASGVKYAAPRMGLVSNVTGGLLKPGDLDAGYWVRHARQAVRFREGMESLREKGYETFLEVGPSPVLLGLGQKSLGEGYGEWFSSLRRGRADWEQLLSSLGRLYVSGVEVDWAGFDRGYGRRRLPLPTYPFQRERYWVEGATSPASTSAAARTEDHPLLQRRVRAALRLHESDLRANRPSYLADHTLFGHTVFPLAGFVEMALAAATGRGGATIEDVRVEEPLLLSEEARVVQLSLDPEGGFRIHSLDPKADAADWRRHVEGRLRPLAGGLAPAASPLEAAQARCREERTPAASYAGFRRQGASYGPLLQGLEALWVGEGEAVARVVLPEALAGEAEPYHLHPVLLEAATQLAWAARGVEPGGADAVPLARGFKRLTAHGPVPTRLWVHAVVAPSSPSAEDSFHAELRLFDDSGRLVVELEGLELRPTSWEAFERLLPRAWASWLYELGWEEKTLLEGNAADNRGIWVLVGRGGELGAALRKSLEARGDACATVSQASTYRALGEQRYEVDPARIEDFSALLKDVAADGQRLRGIVYLWALEQEGHQQALTLGGALHLTQALLQSGSVASTSLSFVTRGAVAVGEQDATAPGQATLWGFARTIPLEHPELAPRCVDLDPDGVDAEALTQELRTWDGELSVAYRTGRRHVARLTRWRPQAPQPLGSGRGWVRPDATYLVTGGLGALGVRVAEWLAKAGARHLTLVGRRAPNEAAQRAIQRLNDAGVVVDVRQADVAQPADVRRLFEQIQATSPAVRGIVHAAGVLDDGAVLQQGWARFERVLAPKLQGGWNLHQESLGLELDFFALFSSVASLLGSAGQANYASANAFLDALAAHRRTLGLPATSVNWGPWAEAGMAAGLGERERRRWAELGFGFIPSAPGLAALGEVLLRGPRQVAVLPARWDKLADSFAGHQLPGFFARVALRPKLADEAQRAATVSGELRRRLDQAAEGERTALLAAYVEQQARRILALGPSTLLDQEQPLVELGLDSLMAVELRNTLAIALDLALPAILVLDHPTLAALTRDLGQRLSTAAIRDAAPTSRMDGAAAERLLNRLEQMSDAEVDSLLGEMLPSGRAPE